VSDDVGAKGQDEELPTFVFVCRSFCNKIGDEGCKTLAAALQANTTLRKLEWVMMWEGRKV
jgi:hypothetical protein